MYASVVRSIEVSLQQLTEIIKQHLAKSARLNAAGLAGFFNELDSLLRRFRT
ncbi:hypothetical protein [Pseudomonas sp. PGPR40]|uniref:hypothetical protein n=1 Tax=Pseudomonas sp. PGPR40 TaxID=2913476 RepID=UPI001EDAF264|nr:hypothetical protein [Pseudomonas sp. PGPR40]